MPDEPQVTPKGPDVPASSPDANTPPQTPPSDTPQPGAKGPDAPAGFHELIKHPEFQPYLQRQIEDQVTARTADAVAQVLQRMGVTPNGNGAAKPDDERAKEIERLTKNFDVDEKRAEELIAWRDGGIERAVTPLRERFEHLDLSMRFGTVFQQNTDAKQYEGKMREIFNAMDEHERNFVLKSPSGAQWLFEEAKRRAGVLPPQARYAGTSTPSRSTPATDKIGGQDDQIRQAIEFHKKGDRANFEKIMAQVVRR